MKKILILITIIFCNITNLHSHIEWVHQHIVCEALKLLELQMPNYDINEINNYIGTCFVSGDCQWDNWYDKDKIILGAFGEDIYDPCF